MADADWGSSSDEEDAAERARKDEEKRQETLALLESFSKTREPDMESGYGSMDAAQRFYAERSQAAGKAMWSERQQRIGKEAAEQKDIDSSMKTYAGIGICICAVLVIVLALMYTQFNTVLHSGGNSTHTSGGKPGAHHTPKIGKMHMPPMTVILMAVALGISIPTTILLCRQRRAKKQRNFAAER